MEAGTVGATTGRRARRMSAPRPPNHPITEPPNPVCKYPPAVYHLACHRTLYNYYMIMTVVRYLKRFAVLIPGIIIAYVSIYNIYPLIDRRVPSIIAFLVTYILAAYVLIPATIRAYRKLIPPRHLPVYSTTPDGFACDPVNVAVIGTRAQLIRAMEDAGWYMADSHSLHNVARLIITTILHQPYRRAPMSSLYLFGRHQDLGFEVDVSDKFAHRHHVRFWATTFDPVQEGRSLDANSIHWFGQHEAHRHIDREEQLLWLGAATKDTGMAFIRHNAQITHMIHPDTDAERDLIVEQLQIDGAKLEAELRIMEAYKLTNRVWRGYLQTDGKLKVVRLAPGRHNVSSKN